MNPSLAAGTPFEVLDHVGEIDAVAVDPGLRERAVQELPGRPHERPALEVLAVAGLLSDQHHLRRRRSLAEDRLRPGAPQVARATARRGAAKRLEVRAGWDRRWLESHLGL